MANDILKTLIAEAYGEGPEAMRLVAETILNRSAIRGLTPEQVVRQPKQYTGLNSPGPAAKKAWQSPEALAAAEAAWQLAQGADDPTGGADHYYAPGTISKPGWARSMKPTVEAGGHAFFSSRPLPPGELPQVASALSTVPTPRNALPVPSVPKRRPDSLNGLHPFDASTNTPRPNADGSVSTEVTRTVQLPGGEWVNVPSLWWGQGSSVRDFGSMGDDQLADFASRYEKSTGNAFPRYASIPEAERAAIARSNEGGGSKAPITYPGNMVDRAFANLPKPVPNLGDELGMSPIQGGKQEAPLFDAAYDERIGAMQGIPEPINSQGMAVGRSREPAPIPAMPSPQLAGRRATDPVLQAALNARNPAQLPPLAPPMNAPGTTIASYSTKPQVSGMSYAGQDDGLPRIPTGFPTTEQIVAGTGFRPPPAIPERLAAGVPGMPELYGSGVAGVGTHAVAPVPFQRPAPTQFAAAPKIAPIPFSRPTAVGSALSVRPMPPMPIARPGIGGPFRQAPVPMPANMRPAPARAPLQVIVNGGNAQPSRPTPQGYINAGNGKLISEETGGVYYDRHLR